MVKCNVEKEKRKHPRAPADFGLRLNEIDRETFATVVDISRAGVLCRSNRPFPPMTQVRIHLDLPVIKGSPLSATVDAEGAVVRCQMQSPTSPDPVYETAIFFTRLEDAPRAWIESYVLNRLS